MPPPEISTPSSPPKVRPPESPSTRGIRIFVFVLALVLVLLGIDELTEHFWLAGLSPSRLQFLHLVRGITVALAAGMFVAWLISRTSPSPRAADVAGWWNPATLTPQQWTLNYGRWFILMRWIAVLVAAVLTVAATLFLDLLPERLARPLLITIAILAITNLVYDFLLRSGRVLRILLPVQIYFDLTVLMVLLHFSGGIENPLCLLMVFHVIVAGIVLSKAQCYQVAAAASGLLAILALLEWSEWVNHYTLSVFPHSHGEHGLIHAAHMASYAVGSVCVQSVILFLSAYFVTTLAERVRYDEHHMAAMAERAESHRQLIEQSLQTTGAALRVLDADLQIHWANARWQEWFGQSDGAEPAARQTAQDGQLRIGEIMLGAGNSARTLQLTTAPLVDRAGAITQVVQLAQDITQQKQTQIQMIRAGKLAAVGELAGQVAHEVNNPIAIISAKSRLLLEDRRGEMSERIAAEIGKITDMADRVARIAQGLLSYCRPATGSRAPLDLREPLRKALGVVEQRARVANVSIEDELPDDLPPVLANSGEMEQVFLNLLLNAIDAMPGGGRLVVGGGATGQFVEVSVEDTGGGIAPEIRERIFEPFFSTKPEGRGTGLGLSICQGLVNSHGGRIELDTQVGRGSRFVVRLPAIAAESEAYPHV